MKLTPKEKKIFEYLQMKLEESNNYIPTNIILDDLFPVAANQIDAFCCLRVHIHNLRKKLSTSGDYTIQHRWGNGYKLVRVMQGIQKHTRESYAQTI